LNIAEELLRKGAGVYTSSPLVRRVRTSEPLLTGWSGLLDHLRDV
jgi:hypothetical protein